MSAFAVAHVFMSQKDLKNIFEVFINALSGVTGAV